MLVNAGEIVEGPGAPIHRASKEALTLMGITGARLEFVKLTCDGAYRNADWAAGAQQNGEGGHENITQIMNILRINSSEFNHPVETPVFLKAEILQIFVKACAAYKTGRPSVFCPSPKELFHFFDSPFWDESFLSKHYYPIVPLIAQQEAAQRQLSIKQVQQPPRQLEGQ